MRLASVSYKTHERRDRSPVPSLGQFAEKVIDGHIAMPELPGIGFEGKANLYREMPALSA